MPRVHAIQTAFNAGVLDPRFAARHDLRQYYQGLSRGDNVLPRPLGGIRRRPGLRYLASLADVLERLDGTLTTPRGGTAANGKDDNRATLIVTTTEIGVLDPYVVARYDLGAPTRVRFADALDFTVTGGNTDEFRIQYSTDDVVWADFGPAFERVDQDKRDFRREGAVTARFWRIAKVGGSNLGAEFAELAEFHLYQETGTISAGRIFAFEFNVEQRYAIAATDRNLAIIQGDVLVANVPAPWTADELADVDYAQSADTMILTHQDHPPMRLVRGQTSALWRLEPVTFTQQPQVDFNDSDSPAPVAEIQEITFEGLNWKQGETFVLEVRGALSRAIVYAGSDDADQQGTTAENIRRELQKVATVGFDGISVAYNDVDSTPGTSEIYTITLDGNSAGTYDLIGAIPQSGSTQNEILVARIQAGSSRAEDAWSALRGWPRCVTFHDGRLWFGGSRSLPQTVFASQIADLFSFETGEGFDDDAIVQTINSDRLNTVQALFSNRELQLFTTGGEATYGRDVLTPENAFPSFQTRYGCARIRPVSIDGATLFIQRTKKVLREFLFNLDEDAYLAAPLTALAPFLVNQVHDLSAWQGSGDDDANYVFLVNGDGTAAVFNTLRSQEIAAWSRWTTAGLFKATAVVLEDIYFLASRTVDGAERLMIERVDWERLTDSAVLRSGSVLSGLEHLEGAEVEIIADGYVLDRETVESGAVTLEHDTDQAEVGLGFPVRLATMPLNSDYGNGDNFLRKKRLVKARIYVHETGALIFNGRRYYDRQYDDGEFDTPPPLYSGMIEISTSSDWTSGPLVIEFGQDTPAPLEILGMDLQLETE